MPLGRHVIVEQTLRDVQKTLTGNCEFIQGHVKSFEMVRGGLVGLDILGGDDLVELNASRALLPAKPSWCTLDKMISL